MLRQTVNTSLGEIYVKINFVSNSVPVIFLHGVYLDHTLWNYQIERISDRTTIAIDMPHHGNSKNITNRNWSLDDCAGMLIEILDILKVEKVYAVGHSWGSMTILRAANKAPGRFESAGFCNMPIEEANWRTKMQFQMQHLMLAFRGFYTRQAAKTLYGKESLARGPELLEYLQKSMKKLTNSELKRTDKSVIIHADNGEKWLESLKVPALALKGKEDYVPASVHLQTTIVEGGHISPAEVPEEVHTFIMKVFEIQSVISKDKT